MASTLIRNVVMVCSIIVLCALVVGCSSSDDGKSANLQRQLDMRADISPENLAALRTQIETLMSRADISVEDLADLRGQVEMLMGRTDISPEDLASLRTQIETAEQALTDAQFDAAVANAMEKIVDCCQRVQISTDTELNAELGEDAYHGRGGWHFDHNDLSSGSGEAIFSQSFPGGDLVGTAIPWRNDAGQLEFHVNVSGHDDPQYAEPLHRDPDVWPGRYIDTSLRNREFDSVTTSVREMEDNDLGVGWQGIEATKVYDGGGRLTVNFYTDVDSSDELGEPWVRETFQHNIVLSEIPSLPAGQDYQYLFLPADGLAGSLDGAAGRFSCAPDTSCGLVADPNRPEWAEGYFPFSGSVDDVVFTPDAGGEPASLSGPPSQDVPWANYLSFGNWLYVPEDVTDTDAFEFGVFAAGGDPFSGANLMALIGAATYTGKAAGMYAESSGPDASAFSADVELTADFGTDSDFGTIQGTISNIALDSGETPALRALDLLSASWLDQGGTSNVFESYNNAYGPWPGGWVEGFTAADGWWGYWGGKFFGNGVATTDIPPSYVEHPASFAGTFGATDGDRNIAGSFGAHKQ